MPLVVYSLLRLALLVAALVAGWAVGMRGWLLVLVATVVAWAVSYLVLNGRRTAAATWLAERAERRRASGRRISARVDADDAAEDAEAERLGARDGAPPAARHPRSHGEAEPEEHPVGELEATRPGEHRAQQHAARAEQHGPDQDPGRDGQQQHEQ